MREVTVRARTLAPNDSKQLGTKGTAGERTWVWNLVSDRQPSKFGQVRESSYASMGVRMKSFVHAQVSVPFRWRRAANRRRQLRLQETSHATVLKRYLGAAMADALTLSATSPKPPVEVTRTSWGNGEGLNSPSWFRAKCHLPTKLKKPYESTRMSCQLHRVSF